MTQVAAIAMALLKGEVLSIMNGFERFSCTNLPREISRSIERRFGVHVSRDKVEYTSKWGIPGYFYRYRLNKTPSNGEGIKRMRDYVKEQLGSFEAVKTQQQKSQYKQTELFLNHL